LCDQLSKDGTILTNPSIIGLSTVLRQFVTVQGNSIKLESSKTFLASFSI